MPELPIRRMIVYKHGVGYFERRGTLHGTALRLSFPREAMDDILKSLVALDLGAGHVLGIDFETPEDRATQVARGSIHLSDNHSLLDLLRDLRGRRVRLRLDEELREPRKGFGLGGRRPEGSDTPDAPPPAIPEVPSEIRDGIEGFVIGIDIEDTEQLRYPLIALYQSPQRRVRMVAIRDIKRLEILDDQAAEDLDYFLRAAQSEEDRRAATLRLSEGEHDLLVGYIAPAPAWRVSYRMLVETASNEQAPPTSTLLLQGWGLFDNQLDEDLDAVELTLVAGMPVSFRYRLYEPHTPERPLVADEERTVAAPIAFGSLGLAADAAQEEMAPMMRPAPQPAGRGGRLHAATAQRSTLAVSVGEERGSLFQYRVAHPISVARGQSAMVPIVAQQLTCRRELLYNSQKLPRNPVASLRMRNDTGLTLERGPVTVIAEGDYAGEAVLPFTLAGSDLILPYAVEMGVTIQEEQRSERRTDTIAVRENYLLIQEWEIQQTTYRISSTLNTPVDILIEQALLPNYTLTDTALPTEQAQGLARWSVHCTPGVETTFSIRQRHEISRREQIRGLGLKQLREFMRRRYLDEPTFQALETVLALYDQITTNEHRIAEIGGERKAIFEQQRQIQGILAPLGREGDEGALRARYVATLGDLEDRLTTLTNEDQYLRDENRRLEEDAMQRLTLLTNA